MVKIKTTSVREKEEEDEQLFVVSKPSNRDDGEDENEDDEGEEEQEASKAKLFSDMMKITKKKGEVQQVVRTTLGTSSVDTSHLLTHLGPSSLKDRENQSLPLPLEKTTARKIRRAAGYENVAMEANKWAKVVKVRREAEQLHFPLERADLRLKTVEKTETLEMRTPLEQEVYSLLQGARLVQEKKETEEEQVVRKSLSLQEIHERNRELWRQKEMKRRYEKKARLMNKSKSRKHHRLLRRERLRKQRAELEELQKTDPEAALERLKELEQVRIEERMSLRHKTSKWAHLQGFRATRDKAAMAALQENQRMHRELTAKTAKSANSEGDDSDDDTAKGEDRATAVTPDPFNPWTKHLPGAATALKGDSTEDESFTRFKKFWEEVNKRKEMDRKIEEQMEKEREERKDEVEEVEKEDGGKGNGDGKQKQDEGEKESQEYVKLQKSDKNVGKTKTPQEKESNSSDNKATKKGSKKKKKNKKRAKTFQNPNQEAVSIDDLFDEVEVGIKNKVKKKLEKLGMKINEPWKVETKNKGQKAKTTTMTDTLAEIKEFDFTSVRNQENTDERKERAKTLQDLEALEGESMDKLQAAVQTLKKDSSATASGTTTTTTVPQKPKLQVDPNKFLQVEAKKLVTSLPDCVGEAGEAMDDEEETEETAEDIMREAFADDYLMEEFSSEKAEAIKKDQPRSMSLALPGWGEWTGPNIKMSNKKCRKFRLRVPHAPRKDSHIGHVLYNERADVHDNLRKAMVSDLPYPFTSVKDFEASVRAPVGRLFVPETAHKRLTAPPIVTKLGTVIQPMTEDELLRRETPVKGEGKAKRSSRESGGTGKKRKAADAAGGQKSQKRKVGKLGAKNHSR